MENSSQKIYYLGSLLSLLALIVLCLAWELLLAPLHPHGSLLALKALPLLLPLRGIYRRNLYTMQWSSMVILLYFTEGIVRGMSDTNAMSAMLAWLEAALVCVYFFCTVWYVRPYKKAAKLLQKQTSRAKQGQAPR